jgi:hypothetical protein
MMQLKKANHKLNEIWLWSGVIPKINGSVNVRDEIKNIFAENTKTPFITGAQTAQNQVFLNLL